jgi:hypothetical protein
MKLILALIAGPLVYSGAVEFGQAELEKAAAARGLKLHIATEVTTAPPDSFEISPTRISGGDRRGLMYGLLEAAAQIRATGRLTAARGIPAVPMRGIRYFLHNESLEKEWYYSRDYWQTYFQMLARNRFNRFNLVFAHQTDYLAPPYPFWISIPEFPEIRARNLTAKQQSRNLEMLQYISQTAADYGVDFTLGIWEHNIQPGMKPSVEGLSAENIGPYSNKALKQILRLCPAIRSVQMRTNSESGIPNDKQVSFYRDFIYPALKESGRLVTLDLRGWTMRPEMLEAATGSGVPVRLSTKYWAEDLGRPYQPAETFAGYSYHNFLQKPRAYSFYWELWGLGSHRLLLWGDPEYVRRAAGTFSLSGSIGFEIDPPLAQKGFGNQPAEWKVATPGKYEFERYWMFYLLWGRLSYDPKASDRLWMGELESRFGHAAAPHVMEAYRNASGVLNEIVAAHLADPNMYIWPEINPGGLIDSYREVLPSDPRFIASIPEAVSNRLNGIASAKQTPIETALALHGLALRTEQELTQASKLIAENNAEWKSTETDLRILSLLAKYHGRKQVAADQLESYYRDPRDSALFAARRELQGAAAVWEQLAKLTTGVYPSHMSFGPQDTGHWTDKLAWVRQDVKTIDDRVEIFKQFGRFLFGFDFGPPIHPLLASWHNTPYLWMNGVEPRFTPVDEASAFDEKTGFGWATVGERSSTGPPPASYRDIRAAEEMPVRLPENALYGDSISGRGAQTFRVRTGDGEFEVQFLNPDRSAVSKKFTAHNGYLDIVFPDEEWTCSGLVISASASIEQELPPLRWPQSLPRPVFKHTPLKSSPPDKRIFIALTIAPLSHATTVRLHYRAVNQLTPFKTLEAPAAKAVFTIPASDIKEQWDLMYYFEVLNTESSGWFEPDPKTATPYYVVTIANPPKIEKDPL